MRCKVNNCFYNDEDFCNKEEVACYNCQHITEKHTDETEMCFCYCDIDNHYINYEKAEVAWCDNWRKKNE